MIGLLPLRPIEDSHTWQLGSQQEATYQFGVRDAVSGPSEDLLPRPFTLAALAAKIRSIDD